MTDSNLSTRYDPKQVEEKWYAVWESAGLFRPEYCQKINPNAEPFCITIPPPNVTGSLHMGHALCYSIQDVIGRWMRMKGKEVLILPGTDHAGIATQKVVEAQLKAEGLSRHDLGREAFLERVWKWKEESGGMILKQFKRLGFAFDWSRERFTMDDAYYRAVLHVFISWFERGLIYRGKRIVNWDPGLLTSVSDIEVYDEIRKGKLYYVRYPFADGEGYIVVATTRPETMLADVAVAVHPEDERYRKFIGRKLILPLVKRIIPLIADEYPDPKFGTGAVKITPAHDPNDFEVGQRMGLDFSNPNEVPVCIDEHAKIIAPGTPYHGLDRYEAREKIVEDLIAEGLLEKVEDYDVPLKISDRSGQVIEPLLSEQWFCRMKELAQPAIEALRDEQIRFIPERFADVTLRWLENIKDWCVSRQLWWGHRIPIYYTEDGHQPIAAFSEEEAEKKAGCKVTQDPDVLDTWFSSAIWPFATLGWPEDTKDLRRYYPTNVLVTARDILYLWVARMIIDGLDFMKKIPFYDVYVHATVLTETGKRMSKSLGTGIDPIEFIDRYGADAMRFSLLVQAGHNQEIRFGEKRIEEARNFCNKIWNASRFVIMNLPSSKDSEEYREFQQRLEALYNNPEEIKLFLELEDVWILSRLRSCALTVDDSLKNYDMADACKALYSFFWSEFCDWYIEIVKSRLQNPDTRVLAQSVLVYALSEFCKLMHPFMPHITEEIYRILPGIAEPEFLDYTLFPSLPSVFTDTEAEALMERQIEIVRAARNLRHEIGIPPGKILPEIYIEGDGVNENLLRSQANFETIRIGKPKGNFVSVNTNGVDLHLPVEGLVDFDREIVRLEKESQKIQAELERLMSRLNDRRFLERANPEIVERDRETADTLSQQLQKILERKKQFEEMKEK
ncbi:MAG TPA: valine--tRNA ligase [Fimbriimonadales bacterium]|nr:valine--tRNA ligase [Fimbriimonadales bacterium]